MSEPVEYVFYINGMTCISCSSIIESFLGSSNSFKIKSFYTDVTTPVDPKKTIITIEDEGKDRQLIWNEIKTTIEDSGFQCKPADYNPEKMRVIEPPKTPYESIRDAAKNLLSSHWFLGILGCALGLTLMLLSFFSGGLPIAVMLAIHGFSILLTVALGAPSYLKAWKDWTTSRAMTMDTLFSLSTGVVLIVSIASFFIPWLPMMIEAALLIYGFKHLGLAIQHKITEKINYIRFQDRVPKVVRFESNNTIVSKKLSDIQPDDVIEVHPGEIIPLDGVCMDESSIYNTIRNGAILPQRFAAGAKVLAGMRIAEQAKPLKIRVRKAENDSYLAKMDQRVAESIKDKAPIQIKTNYYLSYFIPAVIAFALLSGIIIGIFFPPALAIQCAVSVLASACPCTLGLMIPTSIKTGMNKAAEHQVQFTNATALEEAEQVDVVVIDLNGTLTMGIPTVKAFKLLPKMQLSDIDFLNLCVALEEDCTHPVGKAIYDFAKDQSNTQLKVTQKEDSYHSGRVRSIQDKKYLIGSNTLMKQHGISTELVDRSVRLEAGDSLVYVACENTVLGYFIITDPLREDAVKTVQALTRLGKEIHLCTGADKSTAERYAKALGISTVLSEQVATFLENEDKAKSDYIRSLKQQGFKVAMIGDAANDADALAASDFGIAVISQDSDEGTRQQASAIIQGTSLLPVASLFAISKQTVKNINQNLLMSLIYNVGIELIAGGLLVGLGFVLNPGVGVALMVIQACIIFGNIYRFKHQALDHLEESYLSCEQATAEDTSHHRMNRLLPQNCLEQHVAQDNVEEFDPGHFKSPHPPYGHLLPEGEGDLPRIAFSPREALLNK